MINSLYSHIVCTHDSLYPSCIQWSHRNMRFILNTLWIERSRKDTVLIDIFVLGYNQGGGGYGGGGGGYGGGGGGYGGGGGGGGGIL